MGEASLKAILEARRKEGAFRSLEDFCRRVRPPDGQRARVGRNLVRDMILCGAFDSLCPNRRQALWELDAALAQAPEEGAAPRLDLTSSTALAGSGKAATVANGGAGVLACEPPSECRGRSLRPGSGQAFEHAQDKSPDRPANGPGQSPAPTNHRRVADFSAQEKWRYEFDILGLALREHPVSLIRERLRRQGVITAAEARRGRSGRRVKVTGLVIMPHRPPTKSGRTVVFFTLEDETGLLDVTAFESVYQRCGKAIFTQPMVTVTGRLDRRAEVHPSTPLRASPSNSKGRRSPASLTADEVT